MKRIELVHAYAAPLDEVIRFFSETDLIEEKYAKLGAHHTQVRELAETDDGFRTRTERQVPAQVPSVLKAVLGASNQIRQQEQWHWLDDDTISCDLVVEIVGVPVTVQGEMRLIAFDDNQRCENHVTISVSASLPLIGGTLREFVAKDIKRLAEAEFKHIQQQIAVSAA
ncbi:DUF2505 domain-containing protein [Vibrio hangzhouensis]|uniref:DUF2505 domain-containing protein n=1 Tax=Vibrio hangzhouensis TaxID=462991 RepID=A0A1H5ZLS6_9VIBR|nr:DUF2505 domain-containing protein [Vibrio hangzhouensis]SEG37171.1 Protein of unknown function [Vibrio hangzhouensis]